jgi:hypothetical protein
MLRHPVWSTPKHTPRSLDASGNIRFENTKFNGTKLPMMVSTSLNHSRWYELPLSPDSTISNSASIQALSTGLIALPYYLDTNPVIVAMARRQIDEVLADRKRAC